MLIPTVALAQGRYVTSDQFPPGDFAEWHRVGLDCGIRGDGVAACFDHTGQPARTGLPTEPLERWSFTYGSACGLTAAGEVRCGTVAPKGRPSWPPPAGAFRSFELLRSGGEWCGLRADGSAACSLPAATRLVPPPPGQFATLSCEDSACCGVRDDRSLACWGTADVVTAHAPAGRFVDVAVDSTVACALDDAGEPSCWGSPSEVPLELPAGPFSAVDPGFVFWRADRSAVAVTSTWYLHQQVELPPVRWAEVGVAVDLAGRPFSFLGSALGPVPEGAFVDVDAGVDAVCAVSAEGRVRCFGGEGWVVNHAPAGDGFVEVSVGAWVACARRADGSTECWGRPEWMASEDVAFRSVLAGTAREPGRRPGPLPEPVVSLIPGTGTCGRTADGAVLCVAGDVVHRVTGTTPFAARRSTACGVVAGQIRCGTLAEVAQGGGEPHGGSSTGLAVGYEHACSWRDEGAVCWGRTTTNETVPPEGPLHGLALGEKRSCGLRPDGRAVCWGGTPGPAPEAPLTRLAMTQETDLRMHTFVCGLRADDRSLLCWPYGPLER